MRTTILNLFLIPLLAATLPAAADGPDQERARALVQRLAGLVAEDDTSRPDPVRRPGLGDWTFRYDHELRPGQDDACRFRYRYILTARLIGNRRIRDTACSSGDGGETCGWVTLDFHEETVLEPVSGEDRRDRPRADWFELTVGPVTLEHAMLSTNRSHHLLLAEALRGLVEACSVEAEVDGGA